MDHERRRKVRIMYLNSTNIVQQQHLPPCLINPFIIGQQRQNSLHSSNMHFGLLG